MVANAVFGERKALESLSSKMEGMYLSSATAESLILNARKVVVATSLVYTAIIFTSQEIS